MNLQGKIAIVTAAGQGIGRAVAERLIAEGAEVHASDLDAGLMDGLAAASATAVDATNPEAVEAWVSRFPRIDTLVHCVGWVHHGTIEECGLDDWRRSTAITLDSAYYVIRAVVPRMKQHGGSVTAIASVASSVKGFPNRTAYGAHKAGVIGLIKACAADYLKAGIRFNAVNPGTVDSPSLRGRMAALAEKLGGMEAAEKFFLDRQPSGRLGVPEEIAGLCAFLASEDARFMTGQALNIDGGITI
ncbi:2-keto-3-deoxy-L-fuconate dehydrogenase [Rubellimicrobium mesophilum DSM 19309]|uniref:2-keto-3-deoxy-L-fuconate dehydrogenase n=1 Tax=Rubellimicrobium mesophilum DSM 19309 TaxID=442562 RepID=A0A017HS72_9RHOB|nr:SDR family oxidoreductase [Rubellimicrobium mesophilum]EYD77236.1 2-keto-3-deoxy-L-fuconate dehydrogenase [Rubellimicrobium mesophilum DSM 19309]